MRPAAHEIKFAAVQLPGDIIRLAAKAVPVIDENRAGRIRSAIKIYLNNDASKDPKNIPGIDEHELREAGRITEVQRKRIAVKRSIQH